MDEILWVNWVKIIRAAEYENNFLLCREDCTETGDG
jgi:hypothetical protein